MSQGVRVFTLKGTAATPTCQRLARDRFIRGKKWTLLEFMARLGAVLPPRRRMRRTPLDSETIGRRWSRGVGGILSEALLQVSDLLLQGANLFLVVLDEHQDGRLGSGWHLSPQFSG